MLFVSIPCANYAASVVSSATSIDMQLRELIIRNQLSGSPLLKKSVSRIDSSLAQLGKRLFFSIQLSGQSDTACVSCHHPLLGGGDNLPLSIGVDAVDPMKIGPGRKHSPKGFDFDGGPNVPRNAQTTFNAIFYSRCMFWDCRIESLGATPGMNGSDDSIMRTPDTMWGMPGSPANSLLQAQAGFPITAEDEMRARFLQDKDSRELRKALTQRLRDEPEKWLEDFQFAFGTRAGVQQAITFERITAAIAAYEESQIFIQNPWKSYIEGNINAINENAKRGALLFFQDDTHGGYACAQCHRGDFFTDEAFHVMVIPQIGRGKEDGEKEDQDYGRFLQTGNDEDKFAYRTPSLLNVEVTGPYGHSGAYSDLKEVIKHMIDPEGAVANYDFQLKQLGENIQKTRARDNTQVVLEHFLKLRGSEGKKTKARAASQQEIDQLHAFLLALTDPCVKDPVCLAPWLDMPE